MNEKAPSGADRSLHVCIFSSKIADISEDNLVLEVNHIGFNIKIPSSLHSSLPGIGEEIKIHT